MCCVVLSIFAYCTGLRDRLVKKEGPRGREKGRTGRTDSEL